MLKISSPARVFLLRRRRARTRHDAQQQHAAERGSSTSAATAGVVQRALAIPLVFFRARGSSQCEKSKAEGPP